MPKTVALFVDVDTLQHPLRTVHNRTLDPAAVVAAAKAHGELVLSQAIADWGELAPEMKEAWKGLGVETVQVERAMRSREGPQRRREIVRDVVDLEIMARVIETLFPQAGGPEIDRFVLATTDDAAARTVRLVRERFQKDVLVVGVEGVLGEPLMQAATAWEHLPMPPIEPTDLEGLSRLVPLLEELERKKRYLNFKYIRETVVRRLTMPDRSFDSAERLLSEAIGCGLLKKLKIEDKYNPGQQFTAYALDRDNAFFKQYGSGEPAPIHPDEPPPAVAGADVVDAGPQEAGGEAAPAAVAAEGAPSPGAPAAPSLGRAPGRPAPGPGRDPRRDGPGRDHAGRDGRRDQRRAEPVARERFPDRADEDVVDDLDPEVGPPGGEQGDAGDGRGRRGRRRRRGRGDAGPPAPAYPGPSQHAPGGGRTNGGRPGRGGGNQDRTGSRYEAPSRFLGGDDDGPPVLHDDDIDEERILRARGDLT